MKKYNKTHNVFWLLFMGILSFPKPVLAEISNDYYAEAIDKTGEQLKSALHNIIDEHATCKYKEVANILRDLDEDPNNPNNILLIYTNRSQLKSTYGRDENDWCIEHTWPKSHGFPKESDWRSPYTDVHHLRPSDFSVNRTRRTLDFDNGGEILPEAQSVNFDTDSWEVPDKVKGDIARGIFYMAVRYEGNADNEPDLEITDDVGESNVSIPKIGKLSTLLEWHIQDLPDKREKMRNDKIFKWQGNRNPFIDHPEWVSKIWGKNTWPPSTTTSQVKVATLIPSQIVYRKEEIVHVTLPPLPNGQTRYVAVGLPNNNFFALSDFNKFVPFDGVNLTKWQGDDTAIKVLITDDIPSGEYTFYLLRMPMNIEPLVANITLETLGIKKIIIKPLCER